MSAFELEDGWGHKKRMNLKRAWRGSLCLHLIKFIAALLIFLACVTFIVFLCMFYESVPSPSFAVLDVKFYAFNLSSTSLTSNLQITISSRHQYIESTDNNFHLDQLHIYASYRNQQITLPTMIPPTNLGSYDVNVWSPFVNGTEVPLTPDLAASLAQDKTATMPINVEVTGRVRMKSGYVASRHWLKVNCRAYIMFGNYNGSNVIGSAVKNPFDLEKACRTDVGLLEWKIFECVGTEFVN
ncbi:NDR1/HIN1-like protein 1 [Bidens hawaiensis]|uniref:NDR1/HIN1-like protein 1 n=1 Tax=Bidens hawaiensis TaxID=980011 RepID=UPI00404B3077